jgi:CBS domain-containing protein
VDDAGAVVGIVSHGDLLGAKISALAPLSDDERSSLQLSVPVSRVMRPHVWTIGSDALARTAARIMREHKFGCLPVVDAGKLVGILTESDLLALVADLAPIQAPKRPWAIQQVMTNVPVTIDPQTSLFEARSIMARYGIRHLPVVEGGEPLSMVCERDLTIAETIVPDTKKTPAAHIVRLIGGSSLHRVTPDTNVDAVLDDMFRHHRDAVLVVDGKRLVGIFTASDACRILAESLRPHNPTRP